MFCNLLRITVLALAATLTAGIDLALTTEITSEVPISAVSTTPGGRVFILYSRVDGSRGPTLVERINNSTLVPYPNAEWNNYTQGKDISTHFVRANSQRIGPDGFLYIVDQGGPVIGQPVILSAVRLVQVDLQTNNVSRIYHLGNVTYPNSYLDDVRFNGPVAYLTDTGVPGIIVLDRESGSARRVLNDTMSTRGLMPASAEGNLLRSPTGGFEYVHSDQLEVSPDGRYFYYQAVSGGMFRIETDHLTNISLTDAQLESLSMPYAATPPTGGTAIDSQGDIYASDTNFLRIIKIAPNGTMSILLEDPRLLWIDGMWADSKNRLWMPAAQLHRSPLFNNGTNRILKPLYVFSVDIGVGPAANDHA